MRDLLVIDQRGGVQREQERAFPAPNDVVVGATAVFGEQWKRKRSNPVEELVARDVLAAVIERIFVAFDANDVGRLDGREDL